MSNRNDELAKASKELMLKEPFYGLFLMGLNKIWSSEQDLTAGVSLNGLNYELIIGESFWDKLEKDKRRGLLKHELMHIALFHLVNFDHLTNRKVRNIAMDMEINQYIDPNDLPEGAILLDSFPELQLEPYKGTTYYYDKLMEKCNNGAGEKLMKVLSAEPGSSVETENGDEIIIPDHNWKVFEELPEAAKKIIVHQTETILKEVSEQIKKQCGSVPKELSQILKDIYKEEPAKFDWRGFLRRFIGNSDKIYTKKTRRKFNKRYEENPGIKIKPQKHILVGLDVSGSVSTEELAEFLNEMRHIHKMGTEITVAQCDTHIAKVEKFKVEEDYKLYARGGTSFQPVIDLFNNEKSKYTCLIYFTDGEASNPKVTKNANKILWVLSSKSSDNNDLTGTVIKLN